MAAERDAAATALEDAVAKTLQRAQSGRDSVTQRDMECVQVMATLALGQRVADLTDRLGDYLGDDSNLDRLQRALHDANGYGLAELLGSVIA